MKAIIIAGGKGERLKSISGDLPKPLVKIGNKTILEHQFDWLKRNGIKEVTLCLGYRAELFQQLFGDGSKFGLKIDYSVENSPLGTAGAVKNIPSLPESFLIIYGDLVGDVDLNKFVSFASQKGGLGTLLIQDLIRVDVNAIEIDNNYHVVKIHPKKAVVPGTKNNYNNAALYYLTRKLVDEIPEGKSCDFANDIFPKVLNEGKILYTYYTTEFLDDMGTPEWYHKALTLWKQGKFGEPKPAIFLDRDGVINEVEHEEYIDRIDKVRIIPQAAEAIRKLQEHFPIVVVSNQGGAVAGGRASEDEVKKINLFIKNKLAEQGAEIDAFYYCPHYPINYRRPAKREEYVLDCTCRKPKSGMFLQAAKDLKIDLNHSFSIGDSTTDTKAGKGAGCTTILVSTGYGGKDNSVDSQPDYICENILKAAELILELYLKKEEKL